MIVCSCNVLTDHDVRTAVQTDARLRTAGQIYNCLGCNVQCGRCVITIRRIMSETIETAGPGCRDRAMREIA